jgi:hypothetical protein
MYQQIRIALSIDGHFHKARGVGNNLCSSGCLLNQVWLDFLIVTLIGLFIMDILHDL